MSTNESTSQNETDDTSRQMDIPDLIVEYSNLVKQTTENFFDYVSKDLLQNIQTIISLREYSNPPTKDFQYLKKDVNDKLNKILSTFLEKQQVLTSSSTLTQFIQYYVVEKQPAPSIKSLDGLNQINKTVKNQKEVDYWHMYIIQSFKDIQACYKRLSESKEKSIKEKKHLFEKHTRFICSHITDNYTVFLAHLLTFLSKRHDLEQPLYKQYIMNTSNMRQEYDDFHTKFLGFLNDQYEICKDMLAVYQLILYDNQQKIDQTTYDQEYHRYELLTTNLSIWQHLCEKQSDIVLPYKYLPKQFQDLNSWLISCEYNFLRLLNILQISLPSLSDNVDDDYPENDIKNEEDDIQDDHTQYKNIFETSSTLKQVYNEIKYFTIEEMKQKEAEVNIANHKYRSIEQNINELNNIGEKRLQDPELLSFYKTYSDASEDVTRLNQLEKQSIMFQEQQFEIIRKVEYLHQQKHKLNFQLNSFSLILQSRKKLLTSLNHILYNISQISTNRNTLKWIDLIQEEERLCNKWQTIQFNYQSYCLQLYHDTCYLLESKLDLFQAELSKSLNQTFLDFVTLTVKSFTYQETQENDWLTKIKKTELLIDKYQDFLLEKNAYKSVEEIDMIKLSMKESQDYQMKAYIYLDMMNIQECLTFFVYVINCMVDSLFVSVTADKDKNLTKYMKILHHIQTSKIIK